MKKEKLLEMARDYGVETGDNCIEFGARDLIDFANAILELAAQECEKKGGPNTPSYFEINEYIDDAAQAIRNLKGTN